MAKARDAFRTISEVSEALDTPAHVLRFWESKFKQIKPVKRAGGRRYYRPDDLALLAAIKDLLHNQNNAIKDTQRYIRDTGVKAIVAEGHRLLDLGEEGSGVSTPVMPPAATVPDQQQDLFAKPTQEIPPATPTPDALSVDEAEPVPSFARRVEPEAPALETKSAITLPPQPAARDDVGSRILASLWAADPGKLQTQAEQIAPLAAKLTKLRDELRHPW